MNMFKSDNNNSNIEASILTVLNTHVSYEQAINTLINKIKSKILSLKANDYEQLGNTYEEKLLVLEEEFKDNILFINSEKNMSKCNSGSYILKVRDIESYLPVYLSKLEKLYDQLEIKSIGFMVSSFYNKLNQSDLEQSIHNILEIKDFFFRNIKLFDSGEHKKINDKIYEFIYVLLKRELLEYNDSTLYDKLNNNDKINLNMFLVNDIIKSLHDRKDIQKELINKINLSHDDPFNIEIIKEYLEVSTGKREHKEKLEQESKENIVDKRRFVSDKKISPSRFKDLTGIWPFPRSEKDNLILRTFDISCIDYKNKSLEGYNFSYTNINFEFKKLSSISLYETNLEGVDLSKVDFDNSYICRTNLKNTGAKINPQKLRGKCLNSVDLVGLDFTGADFTGVDIRGANLSYTNALINPQTVFEKSLWHTNLEGVNLRHADFTDVSLEFTNLKNTGARINPQIIMWKSLYGTDLGGLDLSRADFTGVNLCETNLRNTNARIDPRITKGLSKTDLRGVTFVVNDFTDCSINGTIFDEGFIPYIGVKNTRAL